jgi:HAD superfamily hydrolase (TIGR01509 family)
VRPRALVFDFDGLILDTEWPEWVSISEEFSNHGVELTLEQWHEVIGSAEHPHWLDWLEAEASITIDRELVRARRLERHHGMIAEEQVLPGVRELLEDARRRRLAVVAASSSSRSWVEGHLRRLGLFEYFHAIRCRDDVEVTKPAPDLFLAALEAVGVAPQNAIAFEDSLNGLRAAKAAGIYTVVVPNRITRSQAFDNADLIVGSLLEFSLRGLATVGPRLES